MKEGFWRDGNLTSELWEIVPMHMCVSETTKHLITVSKTNFPSNMSEVRSFKSELYSLSLQT